MLDLYDSTIKVQMERQEDLLDVFITINEDRNGVFSLGDLNFGETSNCKDWLSQNSKNKIKLAEFLMQIAEKILKQ